MIFLTRPYPLCSVFPGPPLLLTKFYLNLWLQLFLHSFLVLPDCPIPLMRRDLLRKLGATLFLEGQRNHPHHQTTLTEKRKGQLESEVETEDLIGPGMWNIEVPGLAKEVQPMATVAVFFTDQDLVDRS